MLKKTLTILLFLLVTVPETQWFLGAVPLGFAKSLERKSKPIPASLVLPIVDGEAVPQEFVVKYPAISAVEHQVTPQDIHPQIGTIIQHEQVGSTCYDYQQNGSMGRMIAVSPSGHREIAFMDVQGGPFPPNPRYITYNCKSPEGVWCDTIHVDGGPSINAGFCNNDVMHDGREAVIYHRHFDYWYTILALGDTDRLCASNNTFSQKYDIPDSLGGQYGGMWPKMGIVWNAVADTDYIHIVMTEGGPESDNKPLGYVRCHLIPGDWITGDTLLCETPTGQPGVTSPVKLRPNVKLTPNKRVAYFGEVEAPGVPSGEYPNTISVIAVTSPVSHKVAIVFTNKREVGTINVNNDVFYFESTNNGNEWFPQNGGTWPPTLANGKLHNITNYQTTDMERAYTDVAACYDYNDNLHIVWNAHWFDSTAGLVSNDANLYHWSQAGGITRITSAYWGNTNPGTWNRNITKMSISAMDPIYHPDSVYLYCIWTQFDPNDISSGQYSNGDIYGSVSINGGASWGYAYNLTNTKTPGCSPGDCRSEHWSSLAKNLHNGNLHIQYISDRDAGGSTWSEGQWTENPVMYLELQPFRYDSIPFAPAVNYGAGNGPRFLFCADLDGDGDLDLVVANYLGDSVSVLKNNGNGTFQTKVDYAVGDYPGNVFCADLDGDADLDLAVTNAFSDDVSILRNNGNGTFETKVDYYAGDGPSAIFCADLDEDADLDLAVANQNSDNVSILKNNGDGTFQTKVDYGAGDGPGNIFCADLDGDGDLDLAVANGAGDNVSILKNRGDATFQPPVNYETGDNPLFLFCADLDGDTYLDLAVANWYGDNVSILKNNGNGTFQTKADYGVGLHPSSVFCADLDGDADQDLVAANAYSDDVSILKNNGDGTFETKVDYGTGDGASSAFCADLDGDGDLDLAVGNSGDDNVSISKNLTQVPANQSPWAFSLISPEDQDTVFGSVTFQWRIPYDPNFGDQMRYDLYISTSPGFPEPTVYSNLSVSRFITAIDSGTYYWKVKAKDNWGAERWSTQTWSFESRYLDDTLRIIAFSPVDLIVTDPIGDSIALTFNTIPEATYDTTQDYNHDEDNDDIVTIPNRLVGDYLIRVVAEPGGGGGVYSLGIRIDGSNVMMLSTGHPCPSPDEVDTFFYHAPEFKSGDANGDWQVNSADVAYLINYLFVGGPAPQPWQSGDANCDGIINSADVAYLINYLFVNGPPPLSC
jgi:ankyrin repeat protein